MEITFLGTGNAFAPGRSWAAMLVNRHILLDAGPAVLMNMKKMGFDLTDITHIFITHFHGDHFLGLPFLFLEYNFMSKTDKPLWITGPAGIEEKARKALELAYPDVSPRGFGRPVNFVEVHPGELLESGGVYFTVERMLHGGEYLEAFGYNIKLSDMNIAYTGDTAMCDNIYDLISDADLCVLDACTEEISRVHLGINDLREIVKRKKPGARIIMSHLDKLDVIFWDDKSIFIPSDGQTFVFER
ncbi:MAG: MBL fold metallo-hydrolase [bacterium]